jgi:hypothetical protein
MGVSNGRLEPWTSRYLRGNTPILGRLRGFCQRPFLTADVHRYDGLISENYSSGETGQSEMLLGMKFGLSSPTKENSDALLS